MKIREGDGSVSVKLLHVMWSTQRPNDTGPCPLSLAAARLVLCTARFEMYAVVTEGFAHLGTSRIYFTVHELKSLVNLKHL